MIDISIIIPTCNRCESLKDTLDALLRQVLVKDATFEVIVVDNNSKDSTESLVRQYQKNFQGRLKYVIEMNKGAAYTRNRGVQEAKGKILAFTDDDCMPENKWIQKIWDKFLDEADLDGFLGGCVFENGKPFYPDASINKSLLRGNGLNMAFRRRLFEEIGAFDTFLGPGSIGYSGEDTEFIYRAMRSHKKIILCEDIMITHKNRKDQEDKFKFMYRDYAGHMTFLLKHVYWNGDIFAIKNIYWILKGIFSNTIRNLKYKKTCQGEMVKLSGMMAGFIRGTAIWLILAPIKKLCRK